MTKESAAVTFAPFLALGAAVPLSRRLTRSSGRAILTVAALMALVIGRARRCCWSWPRAPGQQPAAAEDVRRRPADSGQRPQRHPAHARVLGAADAHLWPARARLGRAVRDAGRLRLAADADGRGAASRGADCSACGCWAGLRRPSSGRSASRCQRARWRRWGSPTRGSSSAAGGLLAGIGTVGLRMRNAHPNGWGLALLGLVVLVVLAERLIIVVTPNVSAAALFFRSLMPIVPLYAILAAAACGRPPVRVSLLAPSVRWARPALTILAGVAVLIAFWSPLLRERLSSQPLLGRVADRGADAETPQGLRVEALVEAEPWLKANLRADRPDHHRHSAPPGLVRRPGRRGAWRPDRSRLAAADRRAAAPVHPRSGRPARGVVRRRLQRELDSIPAASHRASGARRTRRWPAEPTWSPSTCAATASATRSSTSSATTATPLRAAALTRLTSRRRIGLRRRRP